VVKASSFKAASYQAAEAGLGMNPAQAESLINENIPREGKTPSHLVCWWRERGNRKVHQNLPTPSYTNTLKGELGIDCS